MKMKVILPLLSTILIIKLYFVYLKVFLHIILRQLYCKIYNPNTPLITVQIIITHWKLLFIRYHQ